MASKELKDITREEVAKHNKEGDLWVIIDAKVYDLTKFAALHPGGKSVLVDAEIAGEDATEAFYSLHRTEILLRPQYARLQIGFIPGEAEEFKPPGLGELSAVPYAEPQWLTKGYSSPYYTEGHRKFQRELRIVIDRDTRPEAIKVEGNNQRVSQKLVEQHGELNLNAMRLGPGKHLKGRKLLNGIVTPEEFTYFHELIINQEASRVGQRGFLDGFLAGMVIGLPTILNFGTPELLQTGIVDEILSGKKWISLAITEAFAGSDVAGLKCTATKSEDGKEWIINGTKKWITNGHWSDYFSTACKTDKGLTMILIPRGPGVSTKLISTSYSKTAGTAYITYDNVRVPVRNTLGKVNQGLKVVLSNFNHERWMMTCNAVQLQRNIVEESLKWASQRKVFGKPLIEQAVVRSKLAQMISRVESGQAWLEHITYQMCHMNYAQQSEYLAGPIGLLKQYVTRAGQDTARDATQIFGGRAITQTGLGSAVELYHRTVPFDAILGGAEDVLADLGVRQAQKYMPKNARL